MLTLGKLKVQYKASSKLTADGPIKSHTAMAIRRLGSRRNESQKAENWLGCSLLLLFRAPQGRGTACPTATSRDYLAG